MAIHLDGIGLRHLNAISELRGQLRQVQRELVSGRRDDAFSGATQLASPAWALRRSVAVSDAFRTSLDRVGTRIDIRAKHVEHIGTTLAETSRLLTSFSGRTLTPQERHANALSIAGDALGDLVDTLNARVEDGFLFAGRELGNAPVSSKEALLHGRGERAGVVQVARERYAAERGPQGRAWRTVERVDPHRIAFTQPHKFGEFGVAIAEVNSTLNGVQVHSVGGVTDRLEIGLTSAVDLPEAGQSMTIALKLPDGDVRSIVLEAWEEVAPDPTGFVVVPGDHAATLENLAIALENALDDLVSGDLQVASLVAGARDFLLQGTAGASRRVAYDSNGTPTGFRVDTAADTYPWYASADDPDHARESVSTPVGSERRIAYGLQANERPLVEAVATLAAFQALDPAAPDSALDRVTRTMIRRAADTFSNRGALPQDVRAILTDLSLARGSADRLQSFHTSLHAISIAALEKVERSDGHEAAVMHATLANRLELSYQAAASLGRVSFVDYL